MYGMKYDVDTAAKLLYAFVPISRLNKGETGKVIEEVKAEGIRVIVKNNVPECVMISVEDYDRLAKTASRPVRIIQRKEAEEKRKALIRRIRQNVPPPIPPSTNLARKLVMDEIGPIDVDEDAVNELRRLG